MSDGRYPSGQIRAVSDAVKNRSPYWQWMAFLTFSALLTGYAFDFLGAPETWSQWIDRAVISLGFFILLFGLIWRELSRVRREKYANIQEDLHGIQHIVRDQLTILKLMDGASDANLRLHSHLIQENVQECLNRLASIFTLLTGTKCRATINMIEPKLSSNQPVIYTYMRDLDSERFCDADDKCRRQGVLDLLVNNTDFSSVFGENGERWYFCNDLSAQSNYINSRDPNLTKRNLSGVRGLMNIWRPIDWTLPYGSKIVWPIRQKPIKADLGSEFGFVGFLTIDSLHRGVFEEKFDTHLGASVADSLYYMFVRLDEVGNTGGADE